MGLRKMGVLLSVAGIAWAGGAGRAMAQTPPPANGAAVSPAKTGNLQNVISRMNAAAAKFTSARADFLWDQYQAVVQEHDTQTGTIYFERGKGTTRMAADIEEANGRSAPRIVVYDGAALEFYQPAIKQMTILHAGADRAQYESFLTLGFGGSGADLETNWEVSLLAMESMNGIEVAKLDLKPRTQNVKSMFAHVTIWVDPNRAISLKQIFYEPSGDSRAATYRNIQYNLPIPGNVFHLKTAPGTTIQNR